MESSEELRPPSDWPQRGRLEFRSVTLRYFANEAPALNKLSFTIKEGEKIGIVGKSRVRVDWSLLEPEFQPKLPARTGRTGAGKSSILAALFRLADYEGDILMDDINCKSIGLHDLRGRRRQIGLSGVF